MKIDNPDEILEWDTMKLWNAVQQIEEEGDISKKDIEKIKYGFELKVPIQYIIQEYYDIYPTGKTVNIYGYGKEDLLIFLEEVEKRDREMRKIIFESIDDDDPTQAR